MMIGFYAFHGPSLFLNGYKNTFSCSFVFLSSFWVTKGRGGGGSNNSKCGFFFLFPFFFSKIKLMDNVEEKHKTVAKRISR